MRLDDVIQQPGQQERILKRIIMDALHVAAPGMIISYDAAKGTAVVQPLIKRWGKTEDPPLLLDVPVFFPGYYTFPVSPGDECLVVFADACIDAWAQNGGVSVPVSSRKHDLSDGFAFVGFRSAPNAGRGTSLPDALERATLAEAKQYLNIL